MESAINNIVKMTIYQLSIELKEDYRAIKKIVSRLEQSKIIDVVGNSNNSHKAKIYSFSDDVIKRIKSELQAKQVKSVSGVSSIIERDLQQVKDLQMKVTESENTIKSLNELISNKDKEIQTLTNVNVRLDADIKIKDSEIKLITDKSRTFEAENSRLNQELNTIQVAKNKLQHIFTGVGIGSAIVITALLTLLIR